MDPLPTALAAVLLWTLAGAAAACWWAALAGARRAKTSGEEALPKEVGKTAARPSPPPQRPDLEGRDGYPALVLDRLVEHGATALAADELRLEVRAHQGHDGVLLAAAAGSEGDRVGDCAPPSGVVAEVLAGGAPRLVVGQDPRARSAPPFATSTVAVPLVFGGAVQGVVLAGRGAGRDPFELRELEILGAVAECAGAALEHRSGRDGVELALEDQVEALCEAARARQRVTSRQSAALTKLADDVGRRLGLDRPERVELRYAVRLHDTGTLRVPEHVLADSGRLAPGDELLVRRHPVWGGRILADVPGLEAVALLVRLHRERWDGRGYPHGIGGERIPLASRIVFACAALGAMLSERPYRESLPPEAALAELRERSSTQFDPQVVEAVHAAWPGAFRRDLCGHRLRDIA